MGGHRGLPPPRRAPGRMLPALRSWLGGSPAGFCGRRCGVVWCLAPIGDFAQLLGGWAASLVPMGALGPARARAGRGGRRRGASAQADRHHPRRRAVRTFESCAVLRRWAPRMPIGLDLNRFPGPHMYGGPGHRLRSGLSGVHTCPSGSCLGGIYRPISGPADGLRAGHGCGGRSRTRAPLGRRQGAGGGAVPGPGAFGSCETARKARL